MMSQKPKLVAVTTEESSHITFADGENAFCGKKFEKENMKVLPDYMEPSDLDQDFCHSCLSEYESWINKGGYRAPTVKCKRDRLTSKGVETCESIVSAYEARELGHPSSNGSVPVCQTCYQWIRSIEENDVTTEYRNAEPWLRKSKPPEIESYSGE